jgi:hypothetical protein
MFDYLIISYQHTKLQLIQNNTGYSQDKQTYKMESVV